MIKKLQAELKESLKKLDELQSWLFNNTSHPDFLKIAGDRNHLNVKIAALEFKIDQLESGEPMLGDPIMGWDVSAIIQLEGNSFKNRQ